MKRTYDTGMDNNSIILEVKIGTVGVAYTATYLSRTGGQWTKLSESNEENGNIPESEIGKASYLRSSYIVIRSIIDFGHLSENEREIAVNNINASYIFTGGFSGRQDYNFDNDDLTVTPDKKLVTIIKAIEMI
ncbi:MAG: hypothetical protein ACK44D_05805 [Bacteroidia bacterium]